MLKCEIYLYHVYGIHTNFLEDFENTWKCSYNLCEQNIWIVKVERTPVINQLVAFITLGHCKLS